MSTQEARYYLGQLAGRYRLLRLAETVLISLAGTLVVAAALQFFGAAPWVFWSVNVLTGAVLFLFLSLQNSIFSFGEHEIARHLNQSYGELEESTDLLLTANDLPLLQQLQQQKTVARLEQLYPAIRLPHRILKALMVLALCGAVLLLTLHRSVKSSTSPATLEKQVEKIKTSAAGVAPEKLTVTISPPAYTHLPPAVADNLNLKVPEGSRVAWTVAFNGTVQSAQMMPSGKDSLVMNRTSAGYVANGTFSTPGFYQLQWTDQQRVQRSDFYKMEIIPDAAPQIAVEKPGNYTELPFSTSMSVPVKASVTDDYGLQDSWIVATVSKGDGESVRFREEKLRFSSPHFIQGRRINAERTIDLHALGMEPGDELYFYIEATDGRLPASNHSRTDTYFIAIQDTATASAAFDTGAGVDLLPEYFRSQRQIIIDSEKLLEEKKNRKVTPELFTVRSNDLGHDQKVLRLRYGQFMGEEEEGEGTAAPAEHRTGKEEDVVAKFGHTHDTENEHNLVPEKKDDKSKDNTLAAFVHDHDNGEEATFFEQSIRSKLRAALSLMWDAELHLRLSHPEKSLPYQYKILKLLKEISNDSRVYVRRTGFDPPPVKEDKRLKGDLTEIKNGVRQYDATQKSPYPNILRAFPLIEELHQSASPAISSQQQVLLRQAGTELAVVALEHPEYYLKALSALKNLTGDPATSAQQQLWISELRTAFWNLIPERTPSPIRAGSTLHTLDEEFLKSMEGIRP